MSEVRDDKYNPGLAVLLSLLFTGAGNVYSGQTEKGIIMIVIYFVLWLLSLASGGAFLLIFLPYWIWGMFDAHTTAIEANSEFHTRSLKAKKEIVEEQKRLEKSTGVSEFIESLEKLSKLHNAKVLSQDEFTTKKRSIISGLFEKPPREGGEDFLTALVPLIEKGVLDGEEVQKIKGIVL